MAPLSSFPPSIYLICLSFVVFYLYSSSSTPSEHAAHRRFDRSIPRRDTPAWTSAGEYESQSYLLSTCAIMKTAVLIRGNNRPTWPKIPFSVPLAPPKGSVPTSSLKVTYGGRDGTLLQKYILMGEISRINPRFPNVTTLVKSYTKSFVLSDRGVSLLYDVFDTSLEQLNGESTQAAILAYVNRWGAKELDVQLIENVGQSPTVKALFQVRFTADTPTTGTGTPTVVSFATTFLDAKETTATGGGDTSGGAAGAAGAGAAAAVGAGALAAGEAGAGTGAGAGAGLGAGADGHGSGSGNGEGEGESNHEVEKVTTIHGTQVTTLHITTASPTVTNPGPSNTCTACAVCGDYSYDLAVDISNPDDEGNDPENALVSNPARRSITSQFLKRGDSSRTELGQCPVQGYNPKPDYPTIGTIIQGDKVSASGQLAELLNTALYWAVPAQAPKSCEAPTWGLKTTSEILGMKYSLGGSQGLRVNIDHIWETQLLSLFFTTQAFMAKNARFGCQQVTALFDQPEDPTNPALGTRINALFARLGSNSNPEFVGMDATLNSKKANLWQGGAMMKYKQDIPETILADIKDFTLITSILQDKGVRKLWDTTNIRVYEGFQAIDKIIKDLQCSSAPILNGRGQPLRPGWAANYKKFIDQKIAAQNKLVVASLSAAVQLVPTTAPETDTQEDKDAIAGYAAWLKNWKAKYPSIDTLTIPPASWPSPAAAAKRQEVDEAACERTASGAPTTGTFTMTRVAINTSPPAPALIGGLGNLGQGVPAVAIQTTNTAVAPTASSTDPCGPQVQHGANPDTCNATPQIAAANEAYGITCQDTPNDNGTPFIWDQCMDSVDVICSAMTGGMLSANAKPRPGVWTSYSDISQNTEGCTLGYYLPWIAGSAPVPDVNRCTAIFTAMISGCSASGKKGATINVNALPFTPPANNDGSAVNAGYPSYMIFGSTPSPL